MTNNTVINIISESVTLEGHIKMGSGHVNSITIAGNSVTIMCNNNGSVYCEYCNNVIIEGITWDKCGDGNSNGKNTAGVTFNITNNISLSNCVFQHSPIQAVSLLEVSGNVTVENCIFVSNSMIQIHSGASAALVIEKSNSLNNLNIVISECNIYNNGDASHHLVFISHQVCPLA